MRRLAVGLLVGAALVAGPLVPSRGEELPYRPTLTLGAMAEDRLEHPQGIALDTQGNVVLADRGMARVQRRTVQGQLLQQWVAFNTASGTDRLVAPAGVAVGSDGSIAVADSPRQTVYLFTSQGSLSATIGSGGAGDGQFLTPVGVARDAQNNIYVADPDANRVQKFSPQGQFLMKLGTRGIGSGQFRGPRGVAVDRSGNLYVADSDNHRIQKFDSEGRYVAQWGELGTADGQLSQPTGVAVDPQGNILVADTGNGRVQRFTPQGGLLQQWAVKADWLAVDHTGGIFVTNAQDGKVERFDKDGKGLGAWGRPGTQDGELRSPRGVALGPQGRIVVADTANHRIQVFDATGAPAAVWGSRGSGDGQFESPLAAAVDQQGNVYVADTGNHRMQKFDTAGKFLAQWGKQGSADGEFQAPNALAINGAVVSVLDAGNFRVQKFDTTGKFLGKWGSRGSADGQLVNPTDLAVDAGGNSYIADYAANDGQSPALQRFDLDGRLLRRWTAADLGGANPYGVAVDGSGNVYLTDLPRLTSLFPQAGHDRIVKLDINGKIVAQVGGAGREEGLLAGPTGLAVDQAHSIYVADTLNQRVQKFTTAPAVTPTPVPTEPPVVTPTPEPTPTPPPPPPADAPTLVEPADGAVLTSLGITLAWENPQPTTQYELQLFPYNGDGPALDVIIGDPALVQMSWYTISAPALGRGPYIMLPDMTYSWRVRTSGEPTPLTATSGEWRSWSEIRTFRTPARSASSIIPVTPQDGQRFGDDVTHATLQWRSFDADVFYYELQVSTDPAFATDPQQARAPVWWTLVHGGATPQVNTWVTPPLQRGVYYYWRVRPRVQGDGTPVEWSPAWSFRTSSAPRVQPVIFVPKNLQADPSAAAAVTETLTTVRGWYAGQLGGATFPVNPPQVVQGGQPLPYYCPATISPTQCVQIPGHAGPAPDDINKVLADLAGQGYAVDQSTLLLVFWVGGYNVAAGASYVATGGHAVVGDWALDGILGKYEAGTATGGCSAAPNAGVLCRKMAQQGVVAQALGRAFGLRASVNDSRAAEDPNFWGRSLMADATTFPNAVLLDSPANPEKTTLLRHPLFKR